MATFDNDCGKIKNSYNFHQSCKIIILEYVDIFPSVKPMTLCRLEPRGNFKEKFK